MVTLEQVKLLESKIVRAIGFVTQVTEENNRLKKRNEELEELAARLKDEKARVEEGIISALDRLNQFEDAIGRSISAAKTSAGVSGAAPKTQAAAPAVSAPAASTPAQTASAAAAPAEKVSAPLPAAYTIDEDSGLEEAEDSDEAELDIF
ncbi:MAG: cell division protein ZapB [Treponema sp.]|jgi:peptidoglycan hydrolase CwlO-like protein|nr:cell division protein ZapB [Treponema sp.]